MKKVFVLLLATLSFQAVAYEQILAYECKSTARVGFIYDPNHGWIPNMAKIQGVKYKIFSTPTRQKNKYEVQMGETATLSDLACEDFSPNGILTCDTGLGGHFHVNRNSLRFIHSFDFGFWNVGIENNPLLALHPKTDAESNSPSQQIGTCVKIN